MKGVMTMKKRVVKLCFLFFFIVLSSCFKDDTGIIQNFIAYPNPFSALKDNHITFKTTFKTTDITEYQWTLNIYTENGNLTYTYCNTVTAVASPLLLTGLRGIMRACGIIGLYRYYSVRSYKR